MSWLDSFWIRPWSLCKKCHHRLDQHHVVTAHEIEGEYRIKLGSPTNLFLCPTLSQFDCDPDDA